LNQDTDPVHVATSDLSGDGAVGGQDIQPLVDTLLGI